MANRNRISIGTRFGRLEVQAYERINARAAYVCRCDCGNETRVYSFHLKSGATRSCGCLMVENRTRGTKLRHGHAHAGRPTLTYKSWQAMLKRCHGASSDQEQRLYRDRGITVCQSWRDSFSIFLADMGVRPPGTSIDRIDNYGNYEPGNCRWATPIEQRRNQRRTNSPPG